MASILLLVVFLLLLIGVLLGVLGVGPLEWLFLCGKRGIGGVLAGSVKTGMPGGFLRVAILGILWGCTTLLLAGDVGSVASKFLFPIYSYWLFY